MYALFGFSDTSIHDVSEALRTSKLTKGYDIALIDEDYDEADILLVPNVSRLISTLPLLDDFDGVVLVFDSPVRLDGIQGMDILDITEKKNSFTYTFKRLDFPDMLTKVSDAFDDPKHMDFSIRTANVLPVLLNTTSASILQKISTFFYSIKEQQHRDQVKDIFIDWFFSPEKITVDRLRTRWLKIMPDTKVASIDRLLDGLPLDRLKTVVLRVHRAKKGGKGGISSAKLDAELEGTGVSAFDVRYILSAKAKADKNIEYEAPGITLGELRKQQEAASALEAEGADDEDTDLLELAEAEAACLRA